MHRKASTLHLMVIFLLFGVPRTAAQEITSPDQIPPMSERNLYLQIEMLKPTYIVAEPIYFYVRIESRSSRTEYVTIEEMEPFVVADSLGRPLQPSTDWFEALYGRGLFVPGVGDGMWRAVPAGFTTPRATYNVLQYYGQGNYWGRYYLPPGKYLLWSKLMLSDTAEFRVIDPVHIEDKTVAEKIVRFLSQQTIALSGDPATRIEFFERLLRDFPNSYYSAYSLTALIDMRAVHEGSSNNPQIQEYCLRLLMDYPASPNTNHALIDLDPEMLPSRLKADVRTRLTALRDSLLSGRAQVDIDSLLVRLER